MKNTSHQMYGPSRYQLLFVRVAVATVRELGDTVMSLHKRLTEAAHKSQNFKQAFSYAQQLEIKH